jgi:long-chain fatty acid transport protein
MRSIYAIALGVVLAAAPPRPARADAWQSIGNQRNMLPGGRAAMLGGAYTAVADDATGSYYNPAGLGFVRGDRVEVSGTGYRDARTSYEGAIAGEAFEQKSTVMYPSFLGGTSRHAPLTLAYAFYTLDARNIYQRDSYDDIGEAFGSAETYSRTYQETSSYIWVGGGAALRLSPRLAIGSSMFYYQRNVEYTANELVLLNGGGIIHNTATLQTLNTGLGFVNGLLWSAGPLSLGLAVRTAVALSDRSTLQIDAVQWLPEAEGTLGQGPTATQTRSKYKPFNELNPTTYSFGLALRPFSWLLIAGDVLAHEGVKSPYRDRGGFDLETTLNYSAGLELDFSVVALHGGVFTNNSMFAAPSPEREYQPTAIDYRGYAGGMTLNFSGFHGEFGVVRQTGDGDAQILSGSTAIQRAHGIIDTYLVSGTLPL